MPEPQKQLGWSFSDLVFALLAEANHTAESFAQEHGLNPDDLRSIVDGEPVEAAAVVSLLNVLEWTAPDIVAHLAELERLPLERGRRLAVQTRQERTSATRERSARPGPLFFLITSKDA